MSIRLPAGLPAAAELRREGLDVAEAEALDGDPGRVRVAVLNLMPDKPATERQIARMLALAGHPVALHLFLPDGYVPKHATPEHVGRFYRSWGAIRTEPFDGLIVTGAPIERVAFEDVAYWRELQRILDWSAYRGIAQLTLCWAAFAALYHGRGVAKRLLPAKRFGIFRQTVEAPFASVVRGLGTQFPTPVSRYAEMEADELPDTRDLAVLARSDASGLCLVEDRALDAVHMFNHLEYDAGTLAEEFVRDRRAGLPVAMPSGYVLGDSLANPPVALWRSYGRRFYGNWVERLARRRSIAPVPVSSRGEPEPRRPEPATP